MTSYLIAPVPYQERMRDKYMQFHIIADLTGEKIKI